MDDDIKKFRVGMFVLMGFLILGILIWLTPKAVG